MVWKSDAALLVSSLLRMAATRVTVSFFGGRQPLSSQARMVTGTSTIDRTIGMSSCSTPRPSA